MKSLSTDHLLIDYLANHSQHIATLAQWHQKQWHEISPHLNLEKRIQFMSNHPDNASVPTTLIALVKNKLAGSASLIEDDMDDRPQYHPWLASVFVEPAVRKQGIGSTLISAILQQAQALKLTRIYLFTPDQSKFYSQQGWEVIEHRRFHGSMVDIMIYRLDKQQATKGHLY